MDCTPALSRSLLLVGGLNRARVVLTFFAFLLIAQGCNDFEYQFTDRANRLLSKAQTTFRSNPEEAITLAEKSADLGNVAAMISLGTYEVCGVFRPFVVADCPELSDADRLNPWFVRARTTAMSSESGNDLWFASRLLHAGVGGPVDHERAYEVALESARMGNQNSLLFEAFAAVRSGDNQKVDRILDDARSEDMAIAYQIESYVNAKEDPTDIIGHARPLSIGADKGDKMSDKMLKTLYYDLAIAADRGDIEAAHSIEVLKENALWQQPAKGFYPHEKNRWAEG